MDFVVLLDFSNIENLKLKLLILFTLFLSKMYIVFLIYLHSNSQTQNTKTIAKGTVVTVANNFDSLYRVSRNSCQLR